MAQTASDGLPMVVSMGEPAGIGPEVILKAWLAREAQAISPFFVVGDPQYFSNCAKALGLNVPIKSCEPSAANYHFDTALPVLALERPVEARPGTMAAKDSALVSGAIIKAVELVFAGKAGAIVTAPINKKALYDSGFAYPGHTEFLAGLAQQHTGKQATAVMMLAGPQLRTIPVTIHIALSEVPKQLTSAMIIEAGQIAAHDLEHRFGIAKPRLTFSGLNPHAGEGGSMGREDIEIIQPAVSALRDAGINAVGPLPADTMFHASARARYDVAICMYHDQALIPAKTLGFDDAVNVTLGLPFIRTSPDHGTALDIAGKGIADPSSMIAALRMAAEMAAHAGARRDESPAL